MAQRTRHGRPSDKGQKGCPAIGPLWARYQRNRGKTRGRQGGRGWVATNSGRYGMAGLPGTASLEPR
jgi:hypothetical protein